MSREVLTRCGSCGEFQTVPVAAVGYRCRECQTDWRWAVCGNCDHVQVLRAEVPVVECSRCHTVHVSWWKSSESESLAGLVAARRRREHAAKLRAGRAWAVLGGLLLAAAVVVLWLWATG